MKPLNNDAALNKGSPVLPDINIQVVVNSGQDCREKRITTFSIEDLLLNLLWGCRKKREMEQFQKGINNKSSVHLLLAAEETQFKPSIMFKPLSYFREY